MKKLASSLLPILFLAAACGGNDAANVSVIAEAAGANCANGGVRIKVDDKSYYACNGVEGAVGEEGPAGPVGADGVEGPVGAEGKSPVITTEQVAAGEEGNPCEGPALKVTVVPADESEAVVEYVCQAFEPVIENVMGPFVMLMSGPPAQATEINCVCNYNNYAGSDTVEECIENNTRKDYEVRFQTECHNEAYARYGVPAPQEFLDTMTCMEEAYTTFETCLASLVQQECSEAHEAELAACSDDLQEVAAPCFMSIIESEEVEEWMKGYQYFTQQLNCNF